jgi:hypothetical protein
MLQKNEFLTSQDFNKGLVTRSDIMKNDPNQSPNSMDIKWNFDGSIQKRYGSSTTNSISIGSTGAAGWTIDSGNSLSTSLQNYWKLDEISGNRSDAFSSLTLFDVNTTQSITGIRNQAALFLASASNALVGANTGSIQTGNINFSMSTWIYLNSTSTTLERSIISKRDPEIDSATVLLLHMDGTPFTDSSPAAHSLTTGGNVLLSSTTAKFVNASKFNVVDAIKSSSSSDWNFGTGDFTVDFFFMMTTINTDNVLIAYDTSSNFSVNYTPSIAGGFRVSVGAPFNDFTGFALSVNTWYHFAITRRNNDVRVFIDGTQYGTTQSISNSVPADGINLGGQAAGLAGLQGLMDEARITKGIARWTSNFTPPARAYKVNDYEYWLYINTNQNATFRVSANGSSQSATVQASSIGALNTATWYNIVAWHSNNSHIGISVNLNINTAAYTTGLRIGSAPFVLGAMSDSLQSFATTHADMRQDETGFWKKVLTLSERSDLYGGGTGNTFSGGFSGFGWGMFDFGASSLRWLVVAAGTGLVASSNRGASFVTIASSRTQNYQYFERSKNILVATSDSYDPTLYWAGSAGSFASVLAINSAPSAKYSINYNGFLILLNFMDSNNNVRRRGFKYADENLQITDDWSDGFDFPSSADDEITAAFVLSKFLYISTRYRIFRVAFVGGNPDWSYLKIKDWGFVPRTVKLVTIKGEQVAVGLDWQRRIRVFDGFGDIIISDNVENDNDYCEFALKKVSYAGSGLIVSHAESDPVEQEYRLNLVIGPNSTQTTHAIVLNARTLSMYPYSNQGYQAMCIAESNNQQALMAIDRSGFVHILNSGNLDSYSMPVNEIYDSPIMYKNSPQIVSKAHEIDFYFGHDSYGMIYFQDRVDLSRTFAQMVPFSPFTGAESSLLCLRTTDIKSTHNTYQFRLTSSNGTSEPWKLVRYDLLQSEKGIGRGVTG